MIRTIDTQTFRTAQEVQTCLASLLALELMRPSSALYLYVQEVVDSPIFDNTLFQYAALLPHVTAPQIRLGAILETLSERGVAIRLIVPPMVRRAPPLVPPSWSWAEVRHSDPLHMQGLFTDIACLRGDLRFTHGGVSAGGGTLDLLTADDATLPRLHSAQLWEQLPCQDLNKH